MYHLSIEQKNAIEKIQKHLTHDDKPIEVTPSLCLYWWKIINKGVFNNALREPLGFQCKNFSKEQKDCLGWCKAKKASLDVKIGIRQIQSSKKMFILVLIHEMLHQLQRSICEPMSHKYSFLRWKNNASTILDIELL